MFTQQRAGRISVCVCCTALTGDVGVYVAALVRHDYTGSIHASWG